MAGKEAGISGDKLGTKRDYVKLCKIYIAEEVRETFPACFTAQKNTGFVEPKSS